MKYEDEKKFYQNKGFYIACLLGMFAILSVITVQTKLDSNFPENNNDLVAELPATNAPKTTPNTTETTNIPNLTLEPAPIEIAQVPSGTNAPFIKNNNPSSQNESQKDTDTPKASTAIEEPVADVMNADDTDQGLTWPVKGEVIINYSMDVPVYFTTLKQYKCSRGMVIAGVQGDPVLSACDCKIKEIKRTDEYGLTIVAESGDYTYIYGQLKNPKVSKGDIVKEGQTIASLADPSDSYKEEGCNLYFQVNDGKNSVDPLLLLK